MGSVGIAALFVAGMVILTWLFGTQRILNYLATWEARADSFRRHRSRFAPLGLRILKKWLSGRIRPTDGTREDPLDDKVLLPATTHLKL